MNRGTITMDPLPDYTSKETRERPKEIKVKDDGETDYRPEGSRQSGNVSSHRVSISWKLV